jgi:hypothetical protein
MAKFPFLVFSEVNPDNVSVCAQTHKRSAPLQPCVCAENDPYSIIYDLWRGLRESSSSPDASMRRYCFDRSSSPIASSIGRG